MTRSELRARLAAATSLSKADAAAAVGAMFSAIADALGKDETVTVAGFGNFTTRDRAACVGRNPVARIGPRRRRPRPVAQDPALFLGGEVERLRRRRRGDAGKCTECNRKS